MNDLIEAHYKKNFNTLVKRYSFRAGTEWDAEDIVQNSYENAIKYFKSFNGNDFNKWFGTILVNTFKDYKAKENGMGHDEFDEDDFHAEHASLQVKQAHKEISARIQAKEEPTREVLKLWFEDDFMPKDIAIIAGVTPNNCKVIINRFRNELKEIYK